MNFKNWIKRLIINFFLFIEDRSSSYRGEYFMRKYNQNIKNKTSIRLNGKVTIIFSEGLCIGNNVHIGDNAFIDARAGVIIGDDSHISRNVTIYSTNHNFRGDTLPYNHKLEPKPIIIEQGVWIGMNVSITPGVTIGKGAIISMGSTISKDVAEGEIVASSMQRSIGSRSIVDYTKIGGSSGKVLSEKTINNRTLPILHPKKIDDTNIFILSTGRSGSNSIADYLNHSDKVQAYHETFYTQLGVLGTEYLAGKVDRDFCVEKITKYYETASLSKAGHIYVESDQKIVPFISLMNELVPNCKFIWLIRDPKTFLRSAYARHWFKNDFPEFSNNRILLNPSVYSQGIRVTGDIVKEYSSNEWNQLSQEFKILWYWKYWNNLVDIQLTQLPQEQVLFVKLEDIDIGEIQTFVGESLPLTFPQTNKVRLKHKKTYVQLKSYLDDFYENQGRSFLQNELTKWNYK